MCTSLRVKNDDDPSGNAYKGKEKEKNYESTILKIETRETERINTEERDYNNILNTHEQIGRTRNTWRRHDLLVPSASVLSLQ